MASLINRLIKSNPGTHMMKYQLYSIYYSYGKQTPNLFCALGKTSPATRYTLMWKPSTEMLTSPDNDDRTQTATPNILLPTENIVTYPFLVFLKI